MRLLALSEDQTASSRRWMDGSARAKRPHVVNKLVCDRRVNGIRRNAMTLTASGSWAFNFRWCG